MNKLILIALCLTSLVVACTTPQKTTKAWTPWIGPVTNATQMAELLRLRWPTNVILAYCKTRPSDSSRGMQNLVTAQTWKGDLYTNTAGLKLVYWYANAEDGKLSKYSINAIIENNWWCLEIGSEASLALPVGTPFPQRKMDRRMYEVWLRSNSKNEATETWTPWVGLVTNAAHMEAILGARWTTNIIQDYCQTNPPTPRGLQNLIYTKYVWKGELHTDSIESKRVYWFANVHKGKILDYSVNAVNGTNWWVLETGNEAQLAYRIGKQPTPKVEFNKIFRGWVGREHDEDFVHVDSE